MKKMIQVDNLSKKYLISHEQQSAYATLVETLGYYGKRCLQKIAHPLTPLPQASLDELWALQDVSFSIEEGDRLGIIGRNGAGKSTLLKLLSKITEPTQGRIQIYGRVASLLEVGTGFHLELTGRENIFLNGAILGMPRADIKRNFDAIVAFADIERFLDTPVKRYSSGMYTRLGFAIAAHLDPDILIVDEVLAVGDASFQEKCLKKLNDLSRSGRTIIFVSHDIGSVLALCNKGLFLENGKVDTFGEINTCVSAYMRACKQEGFHWSGNLGDEHIRVYNASLETADSHRQFFYQNERARVEIEYEILKPHPQLVLGIGVWNQRSQLIGRSCASDDPERFSALMSPGRRKVSFALDANLFHEGEYLLKMHCAIQPHKQIITDEIALKFPVYTAQKQTWLKHGTQRDGIFLGNHWEMETK